MICQPSFLQCTSILFDDSALVFEEFNEVFNISRKEQLSGNNKEVVLPSFYHQGRKGIREPYWLR